MISQVVFYAGVAGWICVQGFYVLPGLYLLRGLLRLVGGCVVIQKLEVPSDDFVAEFKPAVRDAVGICQYQPMQ